jgi:hypothetical protein
MDAKSHANLGLVLRYGTMSAQEQRAFVTTQRDRIARMLREARKRVKANKALHGGIYRPDLEG